MRLTACWDSGQREMGRLGKLLGMTPALVCRCSSFNQASLSHPVLSLASLSCFLTCCCLYLHLFLFRTVVFKLCTLPYLMQTFNVHWPPLAPLLAHSFHLILAPQRCINVDHETTGTPVTYAILSQHCTTCMVLTTNWNKHNGTLCSWNQDV